MNITEFRRKLLVRAEDGLRIKNGREDNAAQHLAHAGLIQLDWIGYDIGYRLTSKGRAILSQTDGGACNG